MLNLLTIHFYRTVTAFSSRSHEQWSRLKPARYLREEEGECRMLLPDSLFFPLLWPTMNADMVYDGWHRKKRICGCRKCSLINLEKHGWCDDRLTLTFDAWRPNTLHACEPSASMTPTPTGIRKRIVNQVLAMFGRWKVSGEPPDPISGSGTRRWPNLAFSTK